MRPVQAGAPRLSGAAIAADHLQMTAVFLVLGLLAVVAAWAVRAVGALAAARDGCDRAWSALDLELRRRHELVPGLLEAAHGRPDAVHEARARLAEARTGALGATAPFERANAERELGRALVGLQVAGDADPRHVAELADVEHAIQVARRIYNADVRHYLSHTRSFPGVLIAALGDFPDRPYFELDATREPPAPAVTLAA